MDDPPTLAKSKRFDNNDFIFATTDENEQDCDENLLNS